jgi:hypothetical protein
MAVCTVCNLDRFLIYTQYQEIELDPPRCISCIVRFPTEGIQIIEEDEYSKFTFVRREQRNHAWCLIRQNINTDWWFCPYCRRTLVSPKLGVPTSAGCLKGSSYKLRNGFWADIKLVRVLCPICDKSAGLLEVPRIIKKRPRKKYFPFTCRCFT